MFGDLLHKPFRLL